MENTIIYKGKELKWEYDTVPCFECPIYPLQKEWEDDSDVRNDKCYMSRCTYNRAVAKMVAKGIATMWFKDEDE